MDKKKISIILGAVLAVAAVFMANNYISQQEKRFVKQEKMAYVLVATTNINAGVTIDETMFQFQAVPEQYVQPKAINSESLVVGKRAIADIFPGEQIMSTKLTIAAKDTSLAMRTPPKKRAITITIPPLLAVGGKVRMGDYVDVIGTFPYNVQVDGRTQTEMVSVTLFQNILVLGVEGSSAAARGEAPAGPMDLIVTLALSPREAALLSYTLDQGKLMLVLRPPLDTDIQPVPPVEMNALWQYVFAGLGQEFLQQSKEAPPMVQQQEKQPEAPAPPTLEVFRGTEKSKMVIR